MSLQDNAAAVDSAERRADWHQLAPQTDCFPTTRFMGSKEQLLRPLWNAIGLHEPKTVLDLCSGSGVVSYMLKAQGCSVVANDQMAMANVIADAVIVNSGERLSEHDIESIATIESESDGLIWRLYGDIYYAKEDVAFLDAARIKIAALSFEKRSLALAALIRACIKRRPRGIFTYTGHRYDDGRKDLRMDLRSHFKRAASEMNCAVFAGPPCSSLNVDLSAELPDVKADVVYLDPPYFSPLSDNEYVRRYHFTEALARDWVEVDVQLETKTKKIRNYPNPFRSEPSCVRTIGRVLDAYRGTPVIVSYSTNSLPDAETLLKIMRHHGRRATVVEVDHRYSFANQAAAKSPVRNKVQELIFTAE